VERFSAAESPHRKNPTEAVLLFHGVADNRVSASSANRIPAAPGSAWSDGRPAHGVTAAPSHYGWRERNDTRAIIRR